MRLPFSLFALAYVSGCAAPRCGEGTELEDGECVAEEDLFEADADTDADSDTDTDADTDSDTDSDSDTDADTDTDITDPPRGDFITVTTPWVGDASCVDGYTQVVGTGCVSSAIVSGEVRDFQTGDGVPDATVSVWIDDDATGVEDRATAADADGAYSIDLPVCTPVTIASSTPPEWEETRDTYTLHHVGGFGDRSEDVSSLSEATARLVPALVGVAWEEGTALVIGRIEDCGQAPMENVQVYLHDADGRPPTVTEPFYIDDRGLPAPQGEQAATSSSGQYVLMNVPPGEWTVEAWGWDGDYVRLGAASAEVQGDAVYILDLHVGLEDGVLYPDTCLETCG